MIDSVPALAQAWTAQVPACDGASPGEDLAVGVGLRRDLLPLLLELPGLLLRLFGRGTDLGPLAVHADGVDHPVGARAAGQAADHLDRVLLVVVDDLGPRLRAMSSRDGMPSTAITRAAPNW